MRGLRAVLAAGCVATALLASCSAGGAPSEAADPEGTWGTSGEGHPQLVLDADGSLSGTDGCNRLTGSWSSREGGVEFEQVAMTTMACLDVDTWLSGLASATIDVDTMHVLDESGTEIGTLTKTS